MRSHPTCGKQTHAALRRSASRRAAAARAVGGSWLIVLAAATGCSGPKPPPLGMVEGIVTLDGSPLAAAAVFFTPDGPGRTSIGITDADGRYAVTYLREIQGADLGRHRVRITTATEDNGGRERLPMRYHAKSELTATVEPGANRHDFALTSKP
jgi:hypothetical protein